MWPKSRTPLASYQPIKNVEEQESGDHKPQGSSLWPRAPIPKDQLLRGDNAIKREQLLGGDKKISESLLLGGNKPLAEHLLLQPRQASLEHAAKDDSRLDHEDDDFEHLDYLEPTDNVPLTSRKRFRGRLLRISMRNAIIAATLLVLLMCLVTVFFATGGSKHPLGPEDYRR